MSVVTTGTLPAPVQQAFDYKILVTPTPNFIHKIAAQKKLLPSRNSKTLRMRRYNAIPPAIVPLSNSGLATPPQLLTAVDIDATISWYGSYIIINEQVTATNQDPALNAGVARLGVSMRQGEDILTRDMLASTASSVNCTGGGNGDNPTNLSAADIEALVANLLSSDAYSIADNIEGQDKFGTAPVRDCFLALTHTALTADLQNVAGFLQKNQYPSPMNAMRKLCAHLKSFLMDLKPEVAIS